MWFFLVEVENEFCCVVPSLLAILSLQAKIKMVFRKTIFYFVIFCVCVRYIYFDEDEKSQRIEIINYSSRMPFCMYVRIRADDIIHSTYILFISFECSSLLSTYI